MDPLGVALSAAWTIAGWAVAVPLIALAAQRAPWRRFAASEAVHVWYGGVFCVVMLWGLQATIGEGFTFHLLGVGALTLVVGPALALLGSAVAVALLLAVRGGLWINAGLAFVTMAAVPVAVTWLVLRFAERRLPPNFFIYIFVAAFFGTGLAYGAAGLCGATVLALGAGRPALLVFGEYVPYLVYLVSAEATLSGMALTLAVVYRPQWVATFDDTRYLRGR
jgi:uncharacterized membrane protein